MHVEGTFSEFRDDMRTFIQDLLKPRNQPARRWQFCDLLLVGFIEELNNEFADGNKQKHTSVFVIDWMVKQYSLEGPYGKQKWATKVEKRWFDHGNEDSAERFLDDAESFLNGMGGRWHQNPWKCDPNKKLCSLLSD